MLAKVRCARKLETRTQALCGSGLVSILCVLQEVAGVLTGEKNERKSKKKRGRTKRKE